MTSDTPSPSEARFVVSRLSGGPWVVLDRTHADRLVASCPLRDEALAFAALMNRDPVEALRFAISSMEELDARLPE
jgi:hypothetical protein